MDRCTDVEAAQSGYGGALPHQEMSTLKQLGRRDQSPLASANGRLCSLGARRYQWAPRIARSPQNVRLIRIVEVGAGLTML